MTSFKNHLSNIFTKFVIYLQNVKPQYVFVLLSLFCISDIFAQYGAVRLSFSTKGTFTLSSAKTTVASTPGYLTGGFNSSATGANGFPDFIVQQVDANAADFTAAGTWGNEYEIHDDAVGCTNPVRVYTCRGVYAIEATNPGSGESYAIAGTYDDGVFFATLNAAGTVMTTYRWLWLGNNNDISPPMITASAGTAGDYYICGTVGYRSYVLKINANGTPAWAKQYGSGWNEAWALIESPYNSSELIVVGRYDDPNINGAKAYFMTLNAATGAVSGFNLYGFNNGTHADDWFRCIAPANSTYGGSDGYIVGGRAYDPGGLGNHNYQDWMIKLDRSGGVIWSTLIEPYNGGDHEAVQDIFERYNPYGEYYDYEYYGVSVGDVGSLSQDDTLIVWRLDETGDKAGVWPNEMKYTVGADIGGYWGSSQIEIVGDGSNAGDGFGAWTTDLQTSEFLFMKNYFNGVNGCNEVLKPIKVHQGPGFLTAPSISDQDFVQPCQSFNLSHATLTVQTACWTATVAGGGNRPENITGIGEISTDIKSALFPNPASSNVVFTFNNQAAESKIVIQLQNAIGQVVHEFAAKLTLIGINEEVINLESFNLESGVYYIVADIGGLKKTEKLIYLK